MPVLAGRTRLEIETSIGRNLGAIFIGSWTGNTSATVNTDTKIKSPASGSNGKWLHATSGDESGEIVRVTDDDGSGQLTHDALTGTPSSTGTYIMWDSRYRPEDIHGYIVQAILDLYGRAYNPVEDITLFADGQQTRFTVPLGFSMIKRLEFRASVAERQIDPADEAWTAGSNVTVEVDTEIKKRGQSNKLTLAAGVSAGDVVASNDFGAIDISDYTHVEWWARCSVNTTAGQLKLLLDDTSAATSPIELLSFPALTADTWEPIRVALATPNLDTAIISVGIEDEADIGAALLWIDDVRATHNDRVEFLPVPRRLWTVEKNSRDFVLTEAGRQLVRYAMIKIVGGDEPLELAADSDVNEVSDAYVIAKATALALSANGPFNERTERQIAMWEARASQAYRRLPILTNVRELE